MRGFATVSRQSYRSEPSYKRAAASIRLDRLLFRHAIYMPAVWVRGEPLSRCLRELEQSQWQSQEALRTLQERKLNELVTTAVTHAPYYRERIDPTRHPKWLTLDDLDHLPTLTKDDLSKYWSQLRNPHIRRITAKTTGGSTGQAVTVAKSRLSTAYELAAMWRGWAWAGISLGDRQARFWGVPMSTRAHWRSRLIDFVSHRKRFSAFGMTPASMADITQSLNRFQPDFAYGYVSVLEEFAAFLSAAGGRRFHPKAVIATSEILTSAQRATISAGFGCPVFEEYGCGELGNIAHECEHGRLHVCSENVIVEVLGTNTAATPKVGELVVTELNNHAMPLIRYRLRDFGYLTDAQCACGRPLPILGGVAGRAYDLVFNREGKLFHGEFFMYIFEDAKKRGLGIDAFQVVQQDTDNFLIRVKPGAGYSDGSERFVTERIRHGYGNYARVHFESVESITRERSGKLRLIIGAPRPATSVVADAERPAKTPQ